MKRLKKRETIKSIISDNLEISNLNDYLDDTAKRICKFIENNYRRRRRTTDNKDNSSSWIAKMYG